MAAYNINERCEGCNLADAYGRGCERVLMFPVLVMLTYISDHTSVKNTSEQQANKRLKSNSTLDNSQK